ncbi:hypothetical protein [Flavobacterium chilense]|uniref:Uncharacterized protein n=1 Tax=Flavobacterium chilense TaxID=946677 RepID=A0A1M7LAQ5_9FLAO|nr:hypothetical protein [Flavobacterium chilense]SHM74669.1 hypothetical protein SAMN05444484_10912 [Flavobacterium chilense]
MNTLDQNDKTIYNAIRFSEGNDNYEEEYEDENDITENEDQDDYDEDIDENDLDDDLIEHYDENDREIDNYATD